MNEFRQFADQFDDGDVEAFMSGVTAHLNDLVRGPDAPSVEALEADTEFLRVREQSHQDPYTRRGFEKPRGYAGDAVLLDYIYGTAPVPEGTTEMGANVLIWGQQNSVGFQAVRERRTILAQHMVRARQRNRGARCLAVACGHLRELAMVGCESPEDLSVVALDQDALSLAVAHATYGNAVIPLQAQIGSLIAGTAKFEQPFDLITVAGLYDYLEAAPANRLTTLLARQLKPGGRLVISNFIDCWERGYMEYLMRWKLLYRSVDEVRAFASRVGDGFTVDCSANASNTIAYLQIDRE